MALQYGLEHNFSFVRYEQIADSIMDKTEEIHILQVIRDALSEYRMVPYFQGIYDNNEKRFGLYESLMRISDKTGKIYFPNQFLPVAKKYDLYELLSVAMVKKVMDMFVDGDVKVTINFNVRDIYDREMIKVIFKYLTFGIMILAYVVLFLPYTIQYVSSSFTQISDSLISAGQVFGGSPFYIFRRITLPLISKGVLTGWMMTFIIAFRELVTASLIAPPNTLVVSTYIVREFEQGSVSVGMAMAVLCVLFTTTALVILY